MRDMTKPKLFIMCGLSGSGKSTKAIRLAKKYDAVIVSSDDIRKELCGEVSDQSKNEEVFKVFHKRIRKYLYEGKNVIADATNITMKSRRAIIENVKKLDIEKICYIMAKKYEDCIKDNLNRKNPVPEEVLEKQLRKFQVSFKEEGFDKIVIHGFNYKKHTKLTPFGMICSMTGFDQKNPYHNMSLYEHCRFTYKLFVGETEGLDNYKNGFYMGAELHDIGKLFTQKIDENGIAHYSGHDSVGSYYVLTSMRTLVIEEENKDKFLLDCCFMINYHMFPFSWNTEQINKKWKRRFGEEKYEMLLKLHECDKARVMEL